MVGDFTSLSGHLAMFGVMCWSQLETCYYNLMSKAKNAAKHHMMCRTSTPTTKNYPDLNVSGAIEKFWNRILREEKKVQETYILSLSLIPKRKG